MDGFEATKSILEINRNSPIVALSAEEDPYIENNFFDVGMVAFIQKPASSRRITSCILNYT